MHTSNDRWAHGTPSIESKSNIKYIVRLVDRLNTSSPSSTVPIRRAFAMVLEPYYVIHLLYDFKEESFDKSLSDDSVREYVLRRLPVVSSTASLGQLR